MNQYRCETCTKSDCENHRATEMYYRCYNNSLADIIIDNQQVISRVGCASHSDFQSERVTSVEVMGEIEQVRQKERDKVLDAVEKAISHCPDRSFCLQKIEKLRQAGSP